MAILGGSFISKYLSERVIGLVGGVLFLIFAATTAVGLFA
jgi:putative Ca2+/H+ antiporter (TMEM165/GDT1 family)